MEKVIVKDNIECAFPNVEISLHVFFTLMVTNCPAERSFAQLKHKKSEYSNNETRQIGFLISAAD